jgi:hypothetical protein
MGGKSGFFTVQNEVIGEKWMDIRSLRRGETQPACGVSEVVEIQGQKFGPGKMCWFG